MGATRGVRGDGEPAAAAEGAQASGGQRPPELIVNLLDGEVFDPGGVLSPAWRSMRVLKIAPGESSTLEAADDEYACFVLGGDGTVTVDGRESVLGAGTALVLVHGATADLAGGAEELAIFVTAIAVPPTVSNG